MNKIINGKEIAESILKKLSHSVETLKIKYNIIPGLTVIIIGDNPASHLYVKSKQKKAQLLGLKANTIALPNNITENDLLSIIEQLNTNKDVNGILVQLPLPAHINQTIIMNKINYKKDVDGFHNENIAKLVTGQNDCLIPCTPQGCLYLIKTEKFDISGLNAVVIGRSNIVGKPMCHLLLRENCTVTILHSGSIDLWKHCINADIIVSAVGKPKFVKPHWIKPGAIVIDVGINYIIESEKRKLVGDVDFIEKEMFTSAITPVPGGVGPMTIAFLMINTLIATYRQHNIDYSNLLKI